MKNDTSSRDVRVNELTFALRSWSAQGSRKNKTDRQFVTRQRFAKKLQNPKELILFLFDTLSLTNNAKSERKNMSSTVARNRLLVACKNQFVRRLPNMASTGTAESISRIPPLISTCVFSTDASVEGNQHVVVALGGNALLKRKEAMTVANQRKNIREGLESLKSILQNNSVTMVHGNGPVSFLERKN